MHVKSGAVRDLAARYGGEEIAVLLPRTDIGNVIAVAEKIRDGIRNLKIEHSGSPSEFVTVSAGVDVRVPAQGVDQPKGLIEAADKALYLAKHGGRNRVCMSDRADIECGHSVSMQHNS